MDKDLLNFFERDRFAAYNGIKLITAGPGLAVAEMQITDNHLNAANVVQGGAIFTLADFAFAAAANSYGLITLAINANISYFKPPKGKTLTAKASEISSSRKIRSYNVDVFDENGDIIARLSATGYIKNQVVHSN